LGTENVQAENVRAKNVLKTFEHCDVIKY